MSKTAIEVSDSTRARTDARAPAADSGWLMSCMLTHDRDE